NGLRTTLDIDRKYFMVVVSRHAIGKKESLFPIPIATHHVSRELLVASALRVMLEAIQDISCVKVVHPTQVRLFAVKPGAVGSLMLRRILYGSACLVEISRVAHKHPCAGKKACAQRIGVVHLAVLAGDIRNAGPLSSGKTLKVMQDVLAGTLCNFEILLTAERFPRIAESIANQ